MNRNQVFEELPDFEDAPAYYEYNPRRDKLSFGVMVIAVLGYCAFILVLGVLVKHYGL